MPGLARDRTPLRRKEQTASTAVTCFKNKLLILKDRLIRKEGAVWLQLFWEVPAISNVKMTTTHNRFNRYALRVFYSPATTKISSRPDSTFQKDLVPN